MPRRTASLTRRVLTPVLGIIAVSAAGLAWYRSHNTRLQTQDAAADSAVATIEQFKALRGYYTAEVVAKVKKSSAMKVAVDHAGADAIPLPATMIHDLSARLSDDDEQPGGELVEGDGVGVPMQFEKCLGRQIFRHVAPAGHR